MESSVSRKEQSDMTSKLKRLVRLDDNGHPVCICGHVDNSHADGPDSLDWGTGKCELCCCSRFEPVYELNVEVKCER